MGKEDSHLTVTDTDIQDKQLKRRKDFFGIQFSVYCHIHIPVPTGFVVRQHFMVEYETEEAAHFIMAGKQEAVGGPQSQYPLQGCPLLMA